MNCQTLKNAASTRGVALHDGREIAVTLHPTSEIGVRFVRVDLPSASPIMASPNSIASTRHATVLGHGDATVSTTEHLLAALWARDVTHCRIELDGPEVPILDGSAAPWCELLESAGTVELPAPRPRYALRCAVWTSDGDSFMIGVPHPTLRVSIACEYSPIYVGKQSYDLEISAESFAREIAPARTFTLQEWLAPLREAGLIKGGSLENAVVLGKDAPSSAWRFPDEVARHKALDVLGDVALLCAEDGGELAAHLIVARGGHGLHRAWMLECLRQNALYRVA